MPPYDVIILGAGAAGLMCALTAGQRGKRVLLLEHNDAPGKKIRISGGGRCNFTNVHAEPARYRSSNPRFCTSALARYTPADFIAFVERHAIAYHEKKLGQLFCDGSAQAITDALLKDCTNARVDLRLGCRVRSVQRGDDFSVETTLGPFHAPALVVATGGLSIPKLGATDFGYRLAKQFDLPIVPCEPGLVPLTLEPEDLHSFSDLSGISFAARVSAGKTSFDENVLLTHRGLSGPAILQISSWREAGQPILIDLFPDRKAEEELMALKRRNPKATPRSWLDTQFSSRLAQRLCERNDWTRPLGELPDAAIRAIALTLQQWRVPIAGTEGYAKAEVTTGGVDTKALSPKTMQANNVPGLYFIGEVVDVTGWLGGYNFQWAWASGFAAGNAV